MIQAFKMAMKSISGNKFRAFLTMLGIIIGVMALVILVSLVSGATGTVTDTIESLGSNLLTVTVADDKGAPVTLDTLNAAFAKLLDDLFQDAAMDVSSDISVLNTLLAQEGLTDDGLSNLKKREN